MKTTCLLSLALLLILAGCRRADPAAEKDLATPVLPEGFNEKTLDALKCPENGSSLRFATRRELTNINDRIGGLKMKIWFDKSLQKDNVTAVLIRADGKIGYRVDGGVPILKIEEALVLDENVGPPDAKKNRK